MKRITKYLNIPINIWNTPDLSILEKWVLLSIDSYSDNNGTTMGAQAIASDTNLPTKEVKAILKSLQEKGAISVSVGENGECIIHAYLYKEKYVADKNNVVVGDKPEDASPLPYDEIQQKWNEICFMLPPLQRFTPARKGRVRSVLKQVNLQVEDLYKCFRIIACTPFLSGASDQFKSSFDWLTSKSQNLTKVYEGFYSRSFQEKRDYDNIMRGGDVMQKQDSSDDFYR